MNVLLGVTGSIAAKLTYKIQTAIEDAGHELKTVATNSAIRIGGDCDWRHFYTDEDEWTTYEEEQRVLHIDLVKWADVLVIAPCTANTLAKIHVGISDNLLTCCVRAWPCKEKKHIILVPSMNCEMFDKPLLEKQYQDLVIHGSYSWIAPVEKKLFCGDIGVGAMANIEDIIKRI